MASEEKKQEPKKKRRLLKVGLIILGLGLLAFGGTLALGLITLARDLLYTVVFAETLLVGGALGKKAADGIASSIANRKNKRGLQRKRDREQELDLSEEEMLESLPTYGATRQSDSVVPKSEVFSQKKNQGR